MEPSDKAQVQSTRPTPAVSAGSSWGSWSVAANPAARTLSPPQPDVSDTEMPRHGDSSSALEADAKALSANVVTVSGELKQLAALHEKGALTDKEFEAAKARVINLE